MVRFVIITIYILFISLNVKSQGSYSVLFNSTMDETAWFVYNNNDNNEQIVILTKDCIEDDSDCVSHRLIYIISNEGDTVRLPFDDIRNDTLFSINSLMVEDNGDIFMAGLGWTDDSSGYKKNHFDFHMKWTYNHELIWESMHNRPQFLNPYSSSNNFHILKKMDGNYLVGKTITTTSPLNISFYLLEIDHLSGSIVKEKYIDEIGGGAYLMGLTYNFDSTSVIVHSGRVYMPECKRNTEGAIFLDTTAYDTLRTFCYNRDDDDPQKKWCVANPYNAKLYNNNKLIVAGTGQCIGPYDIEFYIFLYDYDSTLNLTNRKFLTNADTIIDAGMYQNLDINTNGEICVVGNHDRGIGPWNSNYSWIYLAKLDENLELLSERYLGGDAYYTVYGMCATNDGGIVACGTRFDYLTNDFERDAFIIKTDGSLWVGQNENSQIPVHSALVYPNPGGNILHFRTTEYPCSFELYDMQGRLLIRQLINGHLTDISTDLVQKGPYVWVLRKNNTELDKGKWIKIN